MNNVNTKYICTFGSVLKPVWTDLQSIQKRGIKGLLRIDISKLNVVCDLVPIVPSIQNTFLRVIVDLCGVRVVVDEGHSGSHLSVCVRIEGILQVGVPFVVAVHSIQDATHDKAIPKIVPPKPGPPGGLALHAEVRGVQTTQDDHFL